MTDSIHDDLLVDDGLVTKAMASNVTNDGTGSTLPELIIADYPVPTGEYQLMITYGSGTNLRNKFSMVKGATWGEIYTQVSEVTKGKYAFSYEDPVEQERIIRQWNLSEVPLQQHIHD